MRQGVCHRPAAGRARQRVKQDALNRRRLGRIKALDRRGRALAGFLALQDKTRRHRVGYGLFRAAGGMTAPTKGDRIAVANADDGVAGHAKARRDRQGRELDIGRDGRVAGRIVDQDGSVSVERLPVDHASVEVDLVVVESLGRCLEVRSRVPDIAAGKTPDVSARHIEDEAGRESAYGVDVLHDFRRDIVRSE